MERTPNTLHLPEINDDHGDNTFAADCCHSNFTDYTDYTNYTNYTNQEPTSDEDLDKYNLFTITTIDYDDSDDETEDGMPELLPRDRSPITIVDEEDDMPRPPRVTFEAIDDDEDDDSDDSDDEEEPPPPSSKKYPKSIRCIIGYGSRRKDRQGRKASRRI
jgi:hypothetical protein